MADHTNTSTTTSTGTVVLTEGTQSKTLATEDLSRMEGTYGKEVIGKLKKLKVCIIGLRGVGIETAKNLILAGPELVDIHDDAKCEIADLGCNFYLTQDDIERGTSRAQACLPKLQKLNPNVDIKQHSGHFEPAHLDKYDVVVCCDDRLPEQALKDFNDHCRNHKPRAIVFMVAHIQGATGSVFTDFGPSHTILDGDGEPTRTLIVDSILNNQENGTVTIDGKRHLLSDGDHVRFSEVIMKDSKELSEDVTYGQDDKISDINQIHVVKSGRNPKSFTIGNTQGLGEYKGGGIITQVKVAKKVTFNSFEDELKSPSIIDSYMDFTKFDGRAQQLHFARLALYEFLAKHDRVPNYHSEEDAKQVIDLANEINERHKKFNEKPEARKAIVVETIDEKVMRNVSFYAKAELSPMAALFGGILAQEIIKHTGKYTPINQWLHFDAFEILEEKVPEDASHKEASRYEHQIAMFGKKWQEDFEKKNVFVVGCGALGCEYLKMIAMTGLGTKGKVTCTDDDTIELSNLSRQFLFRREHVNKEKSVSASEAVRDMNPDLKNSLDARNIRVETKTENVFNDKFWNSLDFVVNALDNIHARKYIDGKCVIYSKPLFESGTLGTKANNVVCLPHKSPSYSEGAVSGEGQGIAKCTLRNFPSLILHCIEWAREMFDEWFIEGPDILNAFVKDKNVFFEKTDSNPMEALTKYNLTKKWVGLATDPSVKKCVTEVLDTFLTYFRDKIKNLTHHFPEDARVTQKETEADLGPFWHGHKRFPQAAEWNAEKDVYITFVYHSANILAKQVFNLPDVVDKETIKKMCAEYTAEEWKLSEDAIDVDEDKDEEEEKDPGEAKADDLELAKKVKEELKGVDVKNLKVKAADFEKDDANNHHIDVITSATNLRAWNYKIPETTAAKCRMVAGRIIPAIATTTACITGFIGLEIFKQCRKEVALEAYRMTSINLAVNSITMELLPDPIKVKSKTDVAGFATKAIPEGFTTWDFINIDEPDLTLKEFIDHFKKKHHDCTLTLLGSVDKVYYNDDDTDNAEKLKLKLIDIVEKVNGEPIYPEDRNYVIFDAVAVTNADDDDGETPKIKWKFK